MAEPVGGDVQVLRAPRYDDGYEHLEASLHRGNGTIIVLPQLHIHMITMVITEVWVL